MNWRTTAIASAHPETSRARTLSFGERWPPHAAGQHVDVRLTADDGYTAVRSYSIATSATTREIAITVDRLDDGEVSPYLVDVAEPGTLVELRGPAGGWFVWDSASDAPVQLIGGGSGIVPLIAMIRTHSDAGSRAAFRLLYSVRSPESALFRSELAKRAHSDPQLAVDWAYTRSAPHGFGGGVGRLDRDAVLERTLPPSAGATVYVCGATPFVEAVAGWLVDGGHDPAFIRTERYGGILDPV